MKVTLAKLKAEQEKSGKKHEHKVSSQALDADIELTPVVGKLQDCRSDVGQGVSPPGLNVIT